MRIRRGSSCYYQMGSGLAFLPMKEIGGFRLSCIGSRVFSIEWHRTHGGGGRGPAAPPPPPPPPTSFPLFCCSVPGNASEVASRCLRRTRSNKFKALAPAPICPVVRRSDRDEKS